jgi:hypothetical protein
MSDMFAVYCPGHHRRVLLFSEHITELVNQPGGFMLRWRCPCGATGTEHLSHQHLALEAAS